MANIGINTPVQIKNINFQVLTNKQIKQMSIVSKELNGINQTDMFTEGQATRGGLLDQRLGTTDTNTLCTTCGQRSTECHGHHGHTDLAEPVFHYGFLDIIKGILGCICIRCSRLLIHKNETEIQNIIKMTKGKIRFAEIKKITSNIAYCSKTDQNCGAPVPKIKKEVKKSSITIQLIAITNLQENAEISNKKKQTKEILTPKITYTILKNINDEDCRIMGFDPDIFRPEDFIIKIFPIPPIAIRPSVKMSISSTTNYEDMLTGKLVDIIKANIRIRKQIDKDTVSGEESKYFNENIHLLQYHITTYYNNENTGLPTSEQRSGGRATKSISDRIRGKTGRIRGNLMGKRTDYSARTVITSDPNLSLDELGVPIKIAMNITFPEIVTLYNIDTLSKLIKNGRYIYPGANFVIPDSSNSDQKRYIIDLRYRKKGIKLKLGDIVERHLRDGDAVIFNRQPSLHKLSMMSHKVKIINDHKLSTFRINVSVTTPYNADFDGDEMNMFTPQSIATQLEIQYIADVSKQIITPKNSMPIIKLKQDTVIGTYQMTESSNIIKWQDAMNMIVNCNNVDIFKITKNDITTQELFSAIMPPLINITDGNKLSIINGKLIKGVINSKILNDRIINVCWDRYKSAITKDFIDNSQKLVISYHLYNSFSVGLQDAKIPKSDFIEIKKYMMEKCIEVQHLLTEIENYPDLLDSETFEYTICKFLEAVKGDMPKMIIQKLNSSNNFFSLIESGAKGGAINLGQITCGLGQDVLKFVRIEKKVNNRTMVHFCQNDDTAESRGFIINSYYDGLTPTEFYFHHMTGREGLIDTSIKSVTGDTLIIINENNKYIQYKIGEWIDTLMLTYTSNITINVEEEREELILKSYIYIPTMDLYGKTSWGQIKSVTRHNSTKLLFTFETISGRTVSVTDSHSVLVWNNDTNMFDRKNPNTVTINDYFPVTQYLSCDDLNAFINLEDEIIVDDIEKVNELIMIYNFNNIFVNIIRENNKYKIIKSKGHIKINDVVLDKIKCINVFESNNCKVYDLTVPSTMHFCIANGLHVVDTADTGYLARKLIKGMEDVYVAYDGTVRSSNNIIIQYLYGDNHLDQNMQKRVKLNIINLGNKQIESMYKFTDVEVLEIQKKLNYNSNNINSLKNYNNNIVKILRKYRDDLRDIQYRTTLTNFSIEDIYFQPANYSRIIYDVINKEITSSEMLDPLYIISELEKLMDIKVCKLVCVRENEDLKSPKFYNQYKSKYLFQIALTEYLSPKRCLYEYKINKEQFNIIINDIIHVFNTSLVQPGEMVGIVTSQSLGEPLTQMSIHYDANIYIKIIYDEDSYIIKTKIGEFIDTLMYIYNNDVYPIPNHANSTEISLINNKYKYYICSINNSEIINWSLISHLSRHPPNGNLLKIITNSGRTLISTKSHNFLIRSLSGIVAIAADKLTVNMRIPITKYIEYTYNNSTYIINNTEYILDEIFGWFCGVYMVSNGFCYKQTISVNISVCSNFNYITTKLKLIANIYKSTLLKKNSIKDILYIISSSRLKLFVKTILKNNNTFMNWIQCTNIDMVRGFLKGFFECKGIFNKNNCIIKIRSDNSVMIENICFLLTYFNIFTIIKPDKNNNNKYYIQIANEYVYNFHNNIGLDDPHLSILLRKIMKNIKDKPRLYKNLDSIPAINHLIIYINNKLNSLIKIHKDVYNFEFPISRYELKKYIFLFEVAAIKLNKQDIIKKDIQILYDAYDSDVVWDKIISIEEIKSTCNEYVYDITVPDTQTFMTSNLICVHNTLNSIDWFDEIIYYKYEDLNNKITIAIGKFIDNLMSNSENVQMLNNELKSEYLEIKNYNLYTLTVDEDGNISKKLIEAVTRHLPGGKLIKIITSIGCVVSAAKDKSFLILENNKLIPTDGDKLKIGDRVPVDANIFKILDMDHLFNDVYLDEIVSIEEVESSTLYVYDLTVSETCNFILANGLCVRDTFHTTGSGVTGMQGVPRFREILSYTKNPNTPYMVIPMLKEYNNNEHAKLISSYLKYTILSELAEELLIIYDPFPISSNDNTTYYFRDNIDKDTIFFLNNIISANVDTMPWLYRISLSKESLIDNNLTILDIKSRFIIFWNNYISELSNLKKLEREAFGKILFGCIMSTLDNSDELVLHIRLELLDVNTQILLIFQDIILNKFNIRGNEKITNISKIDEQRYLSFDNEDQVALPSKEWIIYTDGIDMVYIRKLIGIDLNRAYCNNISTIYQLFGIEAARTALIKELAIVLEGEKINYTHIELLADVMTNTGNITSIDRHGINRLDTDPLGRASFEKTIEQLLTAAAFNEVDYLRGVSSRIMVGKCIKGGTGLCDLLIDVNLIENAEINNEYEDRLSSKTITNNNILQDLINNIDENSNIFVPFT